MTRSLRQFTLGVLLVWFLFSSTFLGILLLPNPKHAQATVVPVANTTDPVPCTLLCTIGNAIQTAFKAISTPLQSVTATATAWLKADGVLQKALKIAWNVARRKLLDMLVNDIVNWVQGGGEPRFVTDFPGALADVGDAALGKFATTLASVNLCSDFRPAINLLLPPTRPRFEQQIACTASDIYDNFDRIWERDFAQGGWQNWLQIQQPQNNVFGAYLMAQGELSNIISRDEEAKKIEITSGDGFLGAEECSEWGALGADGKPTGDKFNKNYNTGKLTNTDQSTSPTRRCTESTQPSGSTSAGTADEPFSPNANERGATAGKKKQISCYNAVIDTTTGKDKVDAQGKPIKEVESENNYLEGLDLKCQKKQTLTPGSIVGRSVADAVNVDIDWLINADEVGEYVALIVDAVINRVAREGLALATHGAGSTAKASEGYSPSGFDCGRITDPELRRTHCQFGSPENPYIKPVDEDAVQLIESELPLLAQIKIDLQNFDEELAIYGEKLAKIRDVQARVRNAEQNVANGVATIVGAPRDIINPISNRDPERFRLPMPDQAAACTAQNFATVTREPNAATQQDNTIAETFALKLRGVNPTLSKNALEHIGAVSSIASLTVAKTTTYEKVVHKDAKTNLCTDAMAFWNSSFGISASALEIDNALAKTEQRLARIDEQRRIVKEIIKNVGLTHGTADYREVLEKWEARLGIKGGRPTADEDLLDDALDEITPIRNKVVGIGPGNDSGLQDLMESAETEFTNLNAKFIDYRTDVLKESGEIELKVGREGIAEAGGYYGLLAELQEIARAVNVVKNACENPLSEQLSCTEP